MYSRLWTQVSVPLNELRDLGILQDWLLYNKAINLKRKTTLISVLLVCHAFEYLKANHLLKLLHIFRAALFLTFFGTSHLLQLRYLVFQFIYFINSFALGIQHSFHIFCGTKIYISSSINNLQNFQYQWLLTREIL